MYDWTVEAFVTMYTSPSSGSADAGAHDDMSPDHRQASFSHVSWPNSPGRGDDVELPEMLSGSAVVAHDVARDVLDPGLVVAGLVADKHHDHPRSPRWAATSW